MWYLDMNGNDKLDSCSVDARLDRCGQPGDLPVVGKWVSTTAVIKGKGNYEVCETFPNLKIESRMQKHRWHTKILAVRQRIMI
jgi:hypothetical protein